MFAYFTGNISKNYYHAALNIEFASVLACKSLKIFHTLRILLSNFINIFAGRTRKLMNHAKVTAINLCWSWIPFIFDELTYNTFDMHIFQFRISSTHRTMSWFISGQTWTLFKCSYPMTIQNRMLKHLWRCEWFPVKTFYKLNSIGNLKQNLHDSKFALWFQEILN